MAAISFNISGGKIGTLCPKPKYGCGFLSRWDFGAHTAVSTKPMSKILSLKAVEVSTHATENAVSVSSTSR